MSHHYRFYRFTLRGVAVIVMSVGLAACGPSAEVHEGEVSQQGTQDQDHGPNNGRNAAANEGAELGPVGEQVADWSMAHSLVRYGRREALPEALITAAAILARTPAVELSERPTAERIADAPDDEETKPARAVDNRPQALLVEATSMDDRPHIAALAEHVRRELVETPRGTTGGPSFGIHKLPAHTTHTFVLSFNANEPALVAILGDGDTDLDLFVYDENANLIGSDTGATDRCMVLWTPRWTGPFTIKVVNHGHVFNQYALATN